MSTKRTPGRTIDHWPELLRLARTRFDVRRLRPGQREIIDRVLAGQDTLGVLPTGAGKSLCFQLPALVLGGPVVVVSPLLALMKDQHDKLAAADLPVTKLDSSLTSAEELDAVQAIGEATQEVIYVTPERLETAACLDLLKSRKVALLVVDEAHCVSQWGHDFRPAYLSLRDAVRALGRPPLLALTATAPPNVAQDILEQLQMPRAAIVSTGIERPGLGLEVVRTVSEAMKREHLTRLLTEESGSTIVYTATVRAADDLYSFLRQEGLEVARYHGRLRRGDREDAQTAFMEGRTRIMIATKAFGLGIDKADVRLVVHYNFPDSLESYYQEAGRAGRDGASSRAVLLYQVEDRRIQSFFLGGKYPQRTDIRRVLDGLAASVRDGAPTGTTLKALAESTGLPLRKTQVIVSLLGSVGLIERGRTIRLVSNRSADEQIDDAERFYQDRGKADRDRLDQLMHYAQSPNCRMVLLREYFGEPPGNPCQRCDNCRALPLSNRQAELDLASTREVA